jgi:hypothetical protein
MASVRGLPADRLFDPRLIKCREAESLGLYSKIAGVVAAVSSIPAVSSALSCLKAGALDSVSSCVSAMPLSAAVCSAVAVAGCALGVASEIKKQLVLRTASPEVKARELGARLDYIPRDYGDLRKAVADLISGVEMHDDSIKIIVEHLLNVRPGEQRGTYVKVVGNSGPDELALLLVDPDLKLPLKSTNVFVINRAGHYLLAIYDKTVGKMSFYNSSKAMGKSGDIPDTDMQLLVELKAASSEDGSKDLDPKSVDTNHCKNQEGDTHCGFFVIQQALRFFQKGALVQDPRSYSPEEVCKQRLVLADEVIRSFGGVS